MSAPALVDIRILGQPVRVAAGTTILNAVRRHGHDELLGCGCRLGSCGECRISVRYPGEIMPRRELSCLEIVVDGLEVLQLPFPWTQSYGQQAGA